MASLTLNEAKADVLRRVKDSGTSFAAGMRVLPRERREAMYALYAFCREVDDIADDSPSAAMREAGLDLWKKRIRALFAKGEAEDSISLALLPAIVAYRLIEDDFQAIIEGMAMDAREAIIAPSLKELDTYCDHVASAVGRASVRIFGDASDDALRVAHHLGRALQLTNILRDLAEDAQRGRLYLPRELLTQNGLTILKPLDVLMHPALPAACRALAHIAQEHFEATDKAMSACNPTAMRPARLMRDYYKAIYDALLKADWQDPTHRIALSFWQKLRLALRGLMG